MKITSIHRAVALRSFKQDLERLYTAVGLHTYLGNNKELFTNLAGKLCFAYCYAIGAKKLSDRPEAKIILSTVNGLADVVSGDLTQDAFRDTMASCLLAIKRIDPLLSKQDILEGLFELDGMLKSTEGLTTAHIAKALNLS